MAQKRRANYFSRINVLTDAGPADQIIQALADEVLFQNDLILRQSRRRDIYDRMRHRQDEIASAYDSLIDPIAGAPAKIIPAPNDSSDEGRQQAEHLTSLIEDSQGYREIISGILEIPWRGYGGVELTGSLGLGEPLRGEPRVAGAVEIPPESLVFDVLGNPRLQLRGVADVNGIDLLDPSVRWRFIVAQWGSTKGGNWFGTGIALRVYWLWWFLTQNLKDWNKALEKFAMPVLLAAVKAKDWDTLRSRMLRLFKDYVSDSGIVYPEDQVEIDALNQTGRFPAYEKMDEVMRRSIRKAILGETLTMDQGPTGSQALGNVHAETLTKRQQKLVSWAQDILTSTLVCYLSEAEFGHATGHRLKIEFEEQENKELTILQLGLAADLGLPMDRAEVYRKLDSKEVTKDTDPETVIQLQRTSGLSPGAGAGLPGEGAPQPVPDGGEVDPETGLPFEGFQEQGGLVDHKNENRRLGDEDGLVLGTSVRAARMVIEALSERLPTRIRDEAKKKRD